MTTVFTSAQERNADSPGTHVFIVGVGEYPCLLGGDPARLLDNPMGLGQLSSPPLSAVALANWFVGRQPAGPEVEERVGFHNPHAPLASVEMLLSPGLNYPRPDGTIAAVELATRDNIDECYDVWLERAKSHPSNIAVFYFCGHGVAGSSDYILPRDFGCGKENGKKKRNPWADAIDITETARAARREISGSLYFFIDACRQVSRDSLMPGASPSALQFVDFNRKVLCFTRMLLWATGEGAPAFGAKGQVSRFSAALIEALSGFYAEELAGTSDWVVTAEALAKSVRTLLLANNAAADDSMHQHVEQQLIGSQVFHHETEVPKTIGRMVSTWSPNPSVREIVRHIDETLGEEALEALAEQLEQKNRQVDELRREIQEWSRRYRDLERRLTQEPDSEQVQQALSYLVAGKLEEAGVHFDILIEAAETRLAVEHVRLASYYLSRAEVYALQSMMLEALPFFRKAYELCPEETQYSLAYAWGLQQQNDHQRAEIILVSTLSVTRQRAKNNPSAYGVDAAMTLNNLGILYVATQRLNEAETAFREVLEIYRTLAQANPSAYLFDAAMTLNNLGNVCMTTERLNEAKAAFREALDFYRVLAATQPAAHRPNLATTLNNLGSLYGTMQSPTEAEKAYREALDIRRKLAEINPSIYQTDVALTLNNLGALYRDTLRLREAEAVFQEALDMYRKLACDNHVEYGLVATTLINLGSLYRFTQRPTEAETAYQEALDIFLKLANANPSAHQSDVAATLNNFGNLYSATQRPGNAETKYQEALNIRRKLADENPAVYRPKVAETLYNLGTLYLNTRRLTQAEEAFREALDTYRELAHASPARYLPHVAMTLNNLGVLYAAAPRLAEAKIAYGGALAIYRQLAETNPSAYGPAVTLLLNNLAVLQKGK